MDERLRNWLPSITLVVLALSAGVGWRIELELRGGWPGLTWLGYFHWAVPMFVGAFVVWASVFASVKRHAAFVSALGIFSIAAYLVTEMALRFFFVGGPSAMPLVLNLGGGNLDLGTRRFLMLQWASLAVWLLIPLSFCLLCRLFGVPITVSRALCSAALFAISWPAAVFVRGFFEQRGSPDLIHALKSGFVIPFLVASLGFPLLPLPFLTRHEPQRTKTA